MGGIHPRGDRKSVQALENTEDRAAPLRKRVCKSVKRKEIDVRWQRDRLLGMRGGTIEVVADYQNICYHISTVPVKINS
jgi:hypothetical protein